MLGNLGGVERMRLVATIPVKIESTANKREHWSKRAARTKAQRFESWAAFCSYSRMPFDKLTVTITRIAPRELDTDNLAIGCKALRDGVADWLKVNDNDKRIEWKYSQERGAPKYYAARIEIETAEQAVRTLE